MTRRRCRGTSEDWAAFPPANWHSLGVGCLMKQSSVRRQSYLVSGNGVSGEVNKKVVIRGAHRTGILIQPHFKGFPDGCAVLVPAEKHMFVWGFLFFFKDYIPMWYISSSLSKFFYERFCQISALQKWAYKKDRKLPWLMHWPQFRRGRKITLVMDLEIWQWKCLSEVPYTSCGT